MKKGVMALAIVSAFAAGTAIAAPSANDSSSARINFEGKVTASLCQINTADMTKDIMLGEVSRSALDATGKSPAQSFSVTLNNCDSTTNDITYVFSDANGASNNAKYLEPTAGDTSAGGVGVFIQKSDGTDVSIGQTVTLDVIKDGGNLTLPEQTIPLRAYIGKKEASSVVSAGTVAATGVMTIRTAAAANPTP
ncbi:fimbrial protein [Escherichia coli]|uniref:fimbrial protein n=1 Tax=Escherichia coli TaxID=562 RepID=UPI000B42CBBB|nr:fimbrial protein [Escherichia coli]EFJ7371581.1 type 1 fimbrial protein [Escherichia coli]OWC41999.1 fimbrial protein [Escherichia coli]RCP65676.1 type 1 fimbrial protein [Escherichia coli]CAD5789287.1 major fimbrial subunit [Escherichia coli]CAD5790999.1 major fimbrial subunit [Escherichia coli]